MINIILIGAGKLGSRHLQALAKLNFQASIFVVDLNSEALRVAKERFLEVPKNNHNKEVYFLSSINSITTLKIDLAIIATTSDYRCQVIDELLIHCEIRYMILEKILFQKIAEYNYINKLLSSKNIKAWVNCPRRVWNLYSEIKDYLKDSLISEVNVIGPNWSLATSSMHFIDLIAYLTNVRDYEILNMDFNNEVYPAYSSITGSRESKYLEFYGSMKGKFSNGTYFNFTCLKKMQSPFQVSIVTDKNIIHIYEELGIMYVGDQRLDEKWEIKTTTFSMPYQSDLTNLIVEDLILNRNSVLTVFEESMDLHLPLLNSFIQYIGKVKNEILISCPIT
jgi:predicted dehydrogenase